MERFKEQTKATKLERAMRRKRKEEAEAEKQKKADARAGELDAAKARGWLGRTGLGCYAIFELPGVD